MPHRRRHQAFEELADAHIDEDEANAEEPAAHHIHADEAGQQKVDVTAAGLADFDGYDGIRIALPGEDRLGPVARLHALGTGGVVNELDLLWMYPEIECR